MITRLWLAAGLCNPPPRGRRGQVGRPRHIGKRQSTLKQRLAKPRTRWRRLPVTGWYGGDERRFDIVSGTALGNDPGHRVPIRYVLVRDRQGKREPQAFLCTDLDADPLGILRWFVRRWSIVFTFGEVGRHLGVETQRQWSDMATARTTPFLLGLFSLITPWTNDLQGKRSPVVRVTAWYQKSLPTFSETLASARRQLCLDGNLQASRQGPDPAKIPFATLNIMIDPACDAA